MDEYSLSSNGDDKEKCLARSTTDEIPCKKQIVQYKPSFYYSRLVGVEVFEELSDLEKIHCAIGRIFFSTKDKFYIV